MPEAGKRKKPDEAAAAHHDEMTNSQLYDLFTRQMELTKNELAKQINDGMQQTKNELAKQIEEGLQNVRTEIRSELDQMRANLEQTMSSMQASIQKNKDEVHSTADALSRSNNSNDLIVTGVPYVPGENLMQYYQQWCTDLGYSTNNAPLADCRRLAKPPLVSGQNYLILLQFAITNHRSDFYSKYLQSKSFTLDKIGFQSKDRIFVNENLTAPARGIKSKALVARREGKLHSVTTRNGVVYVRKEADSINRPVTNEDQLKSLLN